MFWRMLQPYVPTGAMSSDDDDERRCFGLLKPNNGRAVVSKPSLSRHVFSIQLGSFKSKFATWEPPSAKFLANKLSRSGEQGRLFVSRECKF